MAVKKATPKKSVAKRPAAKKSISKKAAPKKTAAKKAVSRKIPTKKSLAKKSVARKSPVKKSVTKKTTVKKTSARSREASAGVRPMDKFVVPPVPVSSQSRVSRVEVTSVPAAVNIPVPAFTPASLPPRKQGPSGRVIFAVLVGIFLLGLIVWVRAHDSKNNVVVLPSATPTATQSATPTPASSVTPTATPTVAITAHEAPQAVVAQYTSTGATIFWNAPTAIEGLTGYNIEISMSSGPWKLISTVPPTQRTLDVIKSTSKGWSSFRVSSVYADSKIASAKAFGLPGSYS